MSAQEKEILESGANSIVYKENIDGKDCVVKVCRDPSKKKEWMFCATKEDKVLSMLHREFYLSADIPSMHIDNNHGQIRIVQSLVNGEFLSRNMYNSLPLEDRKKISKDLAEVMYAIHNLDVKEVAAVTNNGYIPHENPTKKNTEAYFYGQYEDYIGILGKMIAPETKDLIDTFLQNDFNQIEKVNKHVSPIHNDIRFSNIFYDTHNKKLGVIDFGGCEVNDIYHDFASIGLPNSLGFECQKDVITHYNTLLKRDNKDYQISYEAAKAYSIAKMVRFSNMMHSSEKVRKTLFPQSSDGKIIGMEDYLKEADIIFGLQQNFTVQTEEHEKGIIQNRIDDLRKRLPYSPPISEVKEIDELRGIRSNEASKPIKQTTLNVTALKQKITQNEG